jgi:hypothetical protein
MDKNNKLQHWCGVPAIFGLEGPPMLDFGLKTIGTMRTVTA